MRLARMSATALLGLLAAWGEAAGAGIADLTADGWHTWQLDAAEPVAEMCCVTWQSNSQTGSGCNLDGRRISYGHKGDCSSTAGFVKYYVFVDQGRVTKIRALSSTCPVSADSPIRDHGIVSATNTIEWFRSIIEDGRLGKRVRDEALFGLVQSESDAAYEYLDRLLSSR